MQRCLQLALKGAGAVAPNPMVGAVLRHGDRIIGEGYHRQYGGPHAEVNCIHSVSDEDIPLIPHSLLYVSLEPCNHYGKTPPCTELILKHRIPVVVIACSDPFEKVNGSGIRKLEEAGVKVVTGILEAAARELNKRFFTFHRLHRPYIILKWAQSNDGMIAGPLNRRMKISNELTDRLVHRWRSEEAAIMVGTNTLLEDDPSLTTRLWTGKNPVRVCIDKQLRMPASGKLLNEEAPTIILNQVISKQVGMNTYYKFKEGGSLLKQTADLLYDRSILSLLVEGGAVLLQSFLSEGLWDESRVITNKKMQAGEGLAAPAIEGHSMVKKEMLRNDKICYFKNNLSF